MTRGRGSSLSVMSDQNPRVLSLLLLLLQKVAETWILSMSGQEDALPCTLLLVILLRLAVLHRIDFIWRHNFGVLSISPDRHKLQFKIAQLHSEEFEDDSLVGVERLGLLSLSTYIRVFYSTPCGFETIKPEPSPILNCALRQRIPFCRQCSLKAAPPPLC